MKKMFNKFKINPQIDKIILGCLLFVLVIIFSIKILSRQSIEITAHRGDSVNYPENTMLAFKGAKEKQSDWIELDVQQTKDEQIVVIHDSNLQRTAGVSKNIWEVDFSEINTLDVGSFFSSETKEERIPLLEEVVEFAKNNNLKLNIELKPTGYEQNLEQEVINILKKKKFNDYVIASFSYDVLKKVKTIDKNIPTTFILFKFEKKVSDYPQADAFSVYFPNITKDLVKEIHKLHKTINAWTVNNRSDIESMIELNVDNIITDDITLVKKIINGY